MNAQDGQLSSFGMLSGEFLSITPVAAPLAMSMFVFILQCPIRQCQLYRLTGFSPSSHICYQGALAYEAMDEEGMDEEGTDEEGTDEEGTDEGIDSILSM